MKSILFLVLLTLLSVKPHPTIFLVGDSTVKAGKGTGENNKWGWGSLFDKHINIDKVNLENHAIGGRSSRTFLTEGRWAEILKKLKKGDFVIIQFGHNDDYAINDKLRARGTIKGIGDETLIIDNQLTNKKEVVHSYGWYLRKYATEAHELGAHVYICSPVPQNIFENGSIQRKPDYYPYWAKEVAKQTGSYFVNLHELTAKDYDKFGTETVQKMYFTPDDVTHTNIEGAKLNAINVRIGIKALKKNPLKKYLID
jgi:rhamnogalacturonan acetylesterase